MSGTTLSAASIAAALTPHVGLQPVQLASQSYELESVAAVSQRLLNFYAQRLPPGSRSAFILKPTPGLNVFTTMGTGPVLASASLAGSLFAISGTHAWVLQDDGSAPIDLGVVGSPPDGVAVSIAIGLTGVVFCVPPNAYVTGFAGAPVSQIVAGSGNFPVEGAGSVCYIDGYYVFTSFTGTYFFLSNLLTPTVFSGLSFVYISSQVDYVEFCVAHNSELWLFGQNALWVFYDTGSPTGPFIPRPGAVIRHGIGSSRTIVELDGSLFWLGVDNIVYRTSGYSPVRVSTHALEEILADYDGGLLHSALACGFMFEGHSFYALSLPVIGMTFVYDCESQIWNERCSSADGTGRWNINTASLLGARNMMGDAVTGNIYHTQASFPTEAGVAVLREAVLPVITMHGPRVFMNRLEIEMEVGTEDAPGTVTLDWSDDGGVNYKAPRVLSTGALGATRTRVATTRLGSFRQRVLRIKSMAPATIYGVDVDVPPNSQASV